MIYLISIPVKSIPGYLLELQEVPRKALMGMLIET